MPGFGAAAVVIVQRRDDYISARARARFYVYRSAAGVTSVRYPNDTWVVGRVLLEFHQHSRGFKRTRGRSVAHHRRRGPVVERPGAGERSIGRTRGRWLTCLAFS